MTIHPSDEPLESAGPVPPSVRRRWRGWLDALLALALAVAVGGVAFAIGRSTAPAAASGAPGEGRFVFPGGSFSPDGSFPPGGGPVAGPRGFLAGGLTVRGTVEAIDEDSMTLRLESGTTIEVALDDRTAYYRRASGNRADVSEGSDVLVELGEVSGRPDPSGDPQPLGTADDVIVVP
jgi:hypothetical protein